MKGKWTIAGMLLFVAVYVSSCVVSHGGYHHGGGYRGSRGGHHGGYHGGGGVRHYGR